jgi:hypothetical protein
VLPRPRGMKRLSHRHSPGPRPIRAGLAVALLLPLLAACGSAAAGSGTGANGAETPAPAPSGTSPALCGLSAEGTAERVDGAMRFPATTDYLGKTLDEAKALAGSRKLEVRVVGQDGECGTVTDDLRTERINVYLEKGKVTGVGAF